MKTVEHAPGLHLLLDLWGANGLSDMARLARILRQAAKAAGAEVLGEHLHGFGEGQGVTGVLVLAESHISIHTWPESGFAAVDIFMCGQTDAHAAARVIEAEMAPDEMKLSLHQRG